MREVRKTGTVTYVGWQADNYLLSVCGQGERSRVSAVFNSSDVASLLSCYLERTAMAMQRKAYFHYYKDSGRLKGILF